VVSRVVSVGARRPKCVVQERGEVGVQFPPGFGFDFMVIGGFELVDVLVVVDDGVVVWSRVVASSIVVVDVSRVSLVSRSGLTEKSRGDVPFK